MLSKILSADQVTAVLPLPAPSSMLTLALPISVIKSLMAATRLVLVVVASADRLPWAAVKALDAGAHGLG